MTILEYPYPLGARYLSKNTLYSPSNENLGAPSYISARYLSKNTLYKYNPRCTITSDENFGAPLYISARYLSKNTFIAEVVQSLVMKILGRPYILLRVIYRKICYIA
jgi:hypothetical protein